MIESEQWDVLVTGHPQNAGASRRKKDFVKARLTTALDEYQLVISDDGTLFEINTQKNRSLVLQGRLNERSIQFISCITFHFL